MAWPSVASDPTRGRSAQAPLVMYSETKTLCTQPILRTLGRLFLGGRVWIRDTSGCSVTVPGGEQSQHFFGAVGLYEHDDRVPGFQLIVASGDPDRG